MNNPNAPMVTRPAELHGQVAIVTGAAKGIGGQVCELFAREGANLVLAARDPGPLADLAAAVTDAGSVGRAVTHPCDVTDETETRALVDHALEEFGRIDILVNTAGGTGPIETPCQDLSLIHI